MTTFSVRVQELRQNYYLLRSTCLGKNLEKLVDDIRNKNQSRNSAYLNSLTASTILQAICYYGDREAPISEFEITDEEKLLLIYCIFHNYAWKSFVQMYHTVEKDGSGGADYSQNRLLKECSTLISSSTKRADRSFHRKMYDELETIRNGLEDLQKLIRSNIAYLEEKKALMDKIDRKRTSDIISQYFILSVTFESSANFHFRYKCPVSLSNCLVPIIGSSNINYTPLRTIIDQIFKIPKPVVKKNPKVKKTEIQGNPVSTLSRENSDGSPTSDPPGPHDAALSSVCSGVVLNADGNGHPINDSPATDDDALPSAGSSDGNDSSIGIPNASNAAAFSIDTKLQPGGQQLMDSIFGAESEDDMENQSSIVQSVSIAPLFNYQILTAGNAAETGILIEEEIQIKLDQHYRRAIKDFQLSIETVLRYIEYNQPFKTFFIICDSAPYTFYDRLLENDPSVKSIRSSIIEGSKKYLKNLCLSMFKFLKQLNVYRECDHLDIQILEGLFNEVSLGEKSKFLESLNRPAVLKSIFSVTREEKLLVNLQGKSFNSYKFQLIESISDNVIKNSDKCKDWLVSDSNIHTILSNLDDFGITTAKVTTVKSAIKQYISDDNVLPYTDHGYNTRSKQGAPLISYFGQDSSVPGNKGERKRALSDDGLPDKGNKRLLKEHQPGIISPANLSITKSSTSPKEPQPEIRSPTILSSSLATDEMKVFPELKKQLNTSLEDASTVDAKDQQLLIEAPAVNDILGQTNLPSAKNDNVMEVAVEEECEWFGDSTVTNTVSVNTGHVSKEEHEDFHNNEIHTGKSLDVDNQDKRNSTLSPTLLLPEKKSSNILMNEFTDIHIDTFNEGESSFLNTTSHSAAKSVNDLVVSLSRQLREIKAICTRFEIDFNHLCTVNDTSIHGLDISGIDFEDGKYQPTLFKSDTQEDHTDPVAGFSFIKLNAEGDAGRVIQIQPAAGTTAAAPRARRVRPMQPAAGTLAAAPSAGTVRPIQLANPLSNQTHKQDTAIFSTDLVATSISTIVSTGSSSENVSAAKTKKSQCRILLNKFNHRRDELDIVNKLDSFSLDTINFTRIIGKDAFCSATFTMLLHSIRLYLMSLNCIQCTRSFNHPTLCLYSERILEMFSSFISCIRNNKDVAFNNFNIVVGIPLSSERPFKSAVDHIKTSLATDIPHSCIQLRLPSRNDYNESFPRDLLQRSFHDKLDELTRSNSMIIPDPSILFIDIAQQDKAGSRSSSCINFPFILTRNLPDTLPVTYQTAGAIYWLPSLTGDLYHVSIVTRSRKKLDSIRYSIFEYDIDRGSLSNVSRSSDIEFPAMMKINRKSYYLKGVIMFLNLSSYNVQMSYALQEQEIFRTESASGADIRFSSITSLLLYSAYKKNNSDCWLEDTTINEVLVSFAAYLGDERNVALSSNVLHGIIDQYLNTGEFTDESYARMKDMLKDKYMNVFDSKDSFFHIPVNQTERVHWNFALILMGRKTIIIHDPQYSQSRVIGIGNALFNFCKREAGEDLSLMTDWTIKTSIAHPQQSDNVSCGVFVLISSIRAMCLIKQNRIDDLYKTWTFPSTIDNIIDYRKSFAKILLDDDKEVEFAKFVNMFS